MSGSPNEQLAVKQETGALMPLEQLPLVVYSDLAAFDNYYVHRGNREAVAALQRLLSVDAEDKVLFLWGSPGTGVTHLLQSFQQELIQTTRFSSQYLSLQQVITLDPRSLFESLKKLDIICIDDVHLIQNEPVWQLALFNLFNQFYDQQKKIVFGSALAPRQLVISLADLQSRLCSATVFQLHQMRDEHKVAALQLRANSYGLILTDEVANYILSHSARDTKKLFALLQKLDRASLVEQRKLTIPFVKKILKDFIDG